MTCTFFIVGPTASGKSDLAADVSHEMGAEIVNADAFQVYGGLDLLTAKPEGTTLAKARHHLIGTIPLYEEMNVEKFRHVASCEIDEIHSRGKLAIVVGGSGLYIKALTDGLTSLPGTNSKLRARLNTLSLDELCSRLIVLDRQAAAKVDLQNRRRVVRALEICLLTGRPVSAQLADRKATMPSGVFVFRDRDELYARINQRVEVMFESGVIEEVRAAGAVSSTASQMIGLREIRELLEGKMSILQCVAAIQQSTRRFAKRQLTWFRRQTNFPSLNLSAHRRSEAIELISQGASRVLAPND